MSISIRSWSQEDLANIRKGNDKFLATVFANQLTIQASHLPILRILRARKLKKYRVIFSVDGEIYSITRYATDNENLILFLKQEYQFEYIIFIDEIIVKYKQVYSRKGNK